MYIPTTTGVVPLAPMEGKGFGTLAPVGFEVERAWGLELYPCPFQATPYTGDLVEMQSGIMVPASAVLLTGPGAWRTASSLAAGDTLVVWTDGVPALVTLETAPAVGSGEGFLVRAGDTGVIYGASESGPWILGR